MRTLLLTALCLLIPMGSAQAINLDQKRGKQEEKQAKKDAKEDRKEAKRWDKEDRKEAKEDDKFRRRHAAPQWMDGYWRPQERHYVALVPGDPSRIYLFVGNRWVRRSVRDPGFRRDVQGAWELPSAPPPAPLPRLGLDLKIVLFD